MRMTAAKRSVDVYLQTIAGEATTIVIAVYAHRGPHCFAENEIRTRRCYLEICEKTKAKY